ncbi:MAG: alpha-glucan phosphorylase [Planctomycetes bacterium GWF2_42_9]|nr:MAG: alpha-glucan phosphorylase [Planctomycetes bacterium GWF2_42_9]
MQKIRNFTVLPALPESLSALRTIANNMYWCWNYEFIELFRQIDPEKWEQCGHNPVKLLGSVSQNRLNDLATMQGYIYQLKHAQEKLNHYLASPGWFDKDWSNGKKPVIAYFSFEFGIHESLPIYSGGLGILAGDHLKSASDLGLPLVGVGLMYQKGYFRQYLNADGWQQERYEDNDFYNMPCELVRKKSENPLTIKLTFPSRQVVAQIWQVTVGRVNLYLLDTNIPANSERDRLLTSALYAGDNEMRIQQEILLGIGGFKALLAMGLEPTVCHMNEGHAAFMALERIRHLITTKELNFDQALEATKACNVFTIHTPVKAGNDEFSPELMGKYFNEYYPKLGLDKYKFMSLGRMEPNKENESFKMPVLALRLSTWRNGVSKLHGGVSRSMWADMWPKLPVEEVPIQSITNGIHASSFVSPEMNQLYERYLGFNWSEEIAEESLWQNVNQIPDEELWRIHQRSKEALVSFVRKQIKKQMQRRGTYHTELGWAEQVLDPEALTIGFARRFATYKRGNLLLKDCERMVKLLNKIDKPVQFIFAGKAHPNDEQGKEIIRQIIHFCSRNDVRRRLVFLEDYNIDIARYMVQGVDVWLNNPRVPLEASGTSGMKAALNGALNLSTLDGWWVEGYNLNTGWVIGAGETYDDYEYQDRVESEAIFNLLENEVVPLFYTHSTDNLPRAWIHRMKNSIKWIVPRFNTHRMVAEYTNKFYKPAAAKWESFMSTNLEKVKAAAVLKNRLHSEWDSIKIDEVDVLVKTGKSTVSLNGNASHLEVGSELQISAVVSLGRLAPEDVSVQIYHGIVDAWGNINRGAVRQMSYTTKHAKENCYMFSGTIKCAKSGKCGFAVRVLPEHKDLADLYEPGMIVWESSELSNN